MNCTICGAMIPDGQSNCPSCGAVAGQPAGGYQQPVQPMDGYQQPVQPMGGYQQPVQPMGGYQQPVQPMGGYQQPNMGQPMGGYQQPVQPMGGYQQPNMGQPMGGADFNGFVGSMKNDVMKLIGLIGAFLILISPFFSWFTGKYKNWGSTEKESTGMFRLASEAEIGVFAFFAIMLILVGVVLILWDLADFVPAIGQIKAKVSGFAYMELALVAVALLFVILALANSDLNDFIEVIEDYYDGKASHGFGPIVAFLGIIAAAVPRVSKMFSINISKK